jgi:flagellar L-ring protein precursor FlgH
MRLKVLLIALTLAAAARADSLWERRNPNAYLFTNTHAVRVGDLLTIVVDETTEFAGQDKKELEKKTNHSADLSLSGQYAAGSATSRKFTGAFNGAADSERKLEGTANNTIDRKLVDRMTVTVVAVLPNGNMVIEGRRTSVISHEARTLLVRGVVRPVDIGPYNMLLSHSIADFQLIYEGHGPESSYTNHGWLGKAMNRLWPF